MRDNHYWEIRDGVFGTAWVRGKKTKRYSCAIVGRREGKIAHKYNAFDSVEKAQQWAAEKLTEYSESLSSAS